MAEENPNEVKLGNWTLVRASEKTPWPLSPQRLEALEHITQEMNVLQEQRGEKFFQPKILVESAYEYEVTRGGKDGNEISLRVGTIALDDYPEKLNVEGLQWTTGHESSHAVFKEEGALKTMARMHGYVRSPFNEIDKIAQNDPDRLAQIIAVRCNGDLNKAKEVFETYKNAYEATINDPGNKAIVDQLSKRPSLANRDYKSFMQELAANAPGVYDDAELPRGFNLTPQMSELIDGKGEYQGLSGLYSFTTRLSRADRQKLAEIPPEKLAEIRNAIPELRENYIGPVLNNPQAQLVSNITRAMGQAYEERADMVGECAHPGSAVPNLKFLETAFGRLDEENTHGPWSERIVDVQRIPLFCINGPTDMKDKIQYATDLAARRHQERDAPQTLPAPFLETPKIELPVLPEQSAISPEARRQVSAARDDLGDPSSASVAQGQNDGMAQARKR